MKKTLCIAASLLALAACTREVNIEDPANEVTLIARTETSAESRTVVEGETHVYWEPEDEIKVFQPGKAGRFSTDITTASATAAFAGMMEITEGTDIWAVYPYSDNASFSDGTITTVLPSEQVSRAGSFGKDMNLAVAHSATPELQFFNVGGGVRFSLSQEGIREVVLQGLNGETLAGKVQIAFQDDIPAVQGVTEAKTSITLTPAKGGTFLTDTWYFIVAIPGALENGFKLSFRKADAQGTRVVNKAVTVTRGIYGTLTHADEGVTFNPVSDDNIIFKDDLVKSILVQHFDTNEDGEISYQEAAAVTSFIVDETGTRSDPLIYGVFTETGISTFDELVYFTGLSRIEGFAFAACTQLTSIVIPENVTYIGDYALYACTNLGSITLTSSVPATIGSYSFDFTGNCPIVVPEDAVEAYVEAWSPYADRIAPAKPNNQIWYTSTDGQVVTPCNYDPTGAGRFPDPRDVFGADIVSNTYADGQGVIVFDGEVTAIGEYAFAFCSNLASIELPKSVTSIGNSAFGRCSNLAAITLSEGLISIGSAAFGFCSSLESITIPGSVTSIGQEAFGSCSGLTSIVVSAANKVYDSRRNCNAINETSTNTLLFGCATTEIPEDISKIGDYAFRKCAGLDEVYVPDSVKSIGKEAFAECAGLINIIMDGVTDIGYGAFTECSDLEYVGVSESLTDIGSMAFAYCSSLDEIDFPGIENVGAGAFAYCSSLKQVTLWTQTETIGEAAFYECSGLTFIVVVAPTPPTGGDSMFDGSSCLIYVPEFSWGEYQTAEKWSNYELRIRPIGVDEYITPGVVDLGLPSGLKWASCNLGAKSPEEFGGYYAWGETETKMIYSSNNYKWYVGWQFTKYVTEYSAGGLNGYIDNKLVLDPEDDAAHIKLSGNWRIPRLSDFQELISNCTWQWTQLNGINGYTVIGPNGNSIFLPAAGARRGRRFYGLGSYGRYWSAEIHEFNMLEPFFLGFSSTYQSTGQNDQNFDPFYLDRTSGLTIRPVLDDN